MISDEKMLKVLLMIRRKREKRKEKLRWIPKKDAITIISVIFLADCEKRQNLHSGKLHNSLSFTAEIDRRAC